MGKDETIYPEFKDTVRKVTGKIGKCAITVMLGDMAKLPKDAYVVPEYYDRAQGSLWRSLIASGVDPHANDNPQLAHHGTTMAMKSQGGNARWLLHATCKRDTDFNGFEFSDVRNSLLEALHEAERLGLKSIAIPAMGGRTLSNEQMARAMMSAIDKYDRDDGVSLDITFVLYGDRPAHKQFAATLANAEYRTHIEPNGAKDTTKWMKNVKAGLKKYPEGPPLASHQDRENHHRREDGASPDLGK